MLGIVLLTVVFAFALAFALGTALGFFKKIFAVPEDPLAGRLREALPGANCGACGFPGCDGYAAALAAGTAQAGACSVGGRPVAEALAALLGTAPVEVTPVAAVLACRGTRDKAPLKGDYLGVETCRAALLATGGTKRCAWGCLGYGDCVRACRFGALTMGPEGLPVVDRAICGGCKACAAACPQGLLRMLPRDARVVTPLCSNRNPVKGQVAKSCKAGCIKCGLCVKSCERGALALVDGLPVVDPAKCVGCGVCVGKCPVKVLRGPQSGPAQDAASLRAASRSAP